MVANVFSNFSLCSRVYAFFICLVIVSTFNFGMMIYLENESIDDFEQVSITHEILELKGQLLISILNSETGQRGFLLTSNQDYF